MKKIFRTPEMHKKYLEYLAQQTPESACALCAMAPMETFTYWKIVINDFPYDLLTTQHHMAIPLRHATEGELTEEEWAEFQVLKKGYINDNYEYLMEGTDRTKSMPTHFHMHLLDLNEP